MTRDEHEELHLLRKALHDAKKKAFRIDHTRPNAEINAEIDAVIEAELLRDEDFSELVMQAIRLQ